MAVPRVRGYAAARSSLNLEEVASDRAASEGDWALARARAAARLRARDLTPAEHRAIRGARAEVGAALRRARVRRGRTPYTPAGKVRPLRRPRSYRRLAIAACSLALAGLALTLFLPSSPAVGTSPGATPAEAPTAIRRETATSRGRSLDVVALVAAEPTPEPSAEPTPAPAASPIPAPAAASPVSAPVAGAPSARGTGTGSGGAGASPGPGQAATPAPASPVPASATPAPRTPAPTPIPRPANVTRFTGRVVDSRTGAGIAGVCIVVGVRACVERDPHTDAAGRFALDLPVGATWDINFAHATYRTGYRRLVSSTVRNVDIGTIRLSRR